MTQNHDRRSVRVTRTQYQTLLLAAFVAAASASFVGAPYPREQVLKRVVTWDDLCPILVVEIISPRRPNKDTNRNRQLYWMAGGIAEYWIIDPRKDAFRPAMTALRRESGQPDWHEFEIAPGERYTTGLLPVVSFQPHRRIDSMRLRAC